ncbi:MAG TPA: flagellar biosynthesis protein FlhB [Steroidobacteraceae bacterium]|nr:flagellar biosynthesis protein FlhB [Steroidobacteraceae bacterium]
MAEGGQEKTESATPKRLEEARKRGQLPRSTDLSTAAVCIAAAVAIYSLGRVSAGQFADLMHDGLQISAERAMDAQSLWPALRDTAARAIWIVLPILGATFVAALAAPIAIGGWNFSTEALMPQFSRLNPMSGFGRMFSARGGVELGKGLAKVAVVATMGYVLLKGQTAQMMGLSSEPVNGAISHAAALAAYSLLVLCCGLAVIAAVDVPFQLWQHHRDLKMTREEVREEYKESEGSPEVRGRIREAQRALARGRQLQEVPTADVVITNPTHFAVALRYDENKMRAPLVIAKGTDLLALKIREIAAENGVAVVEAPPLARALYRTVELGREVPAALYIAVAQVLTYVYQLKAAREKGVAPPPLPQVEVPQAANAAPNSNDTPAGAGDEN